MGTNRAKAVAVVVGSSVALLAGALFLVGRRRRRWRRREKPQSEFRRVLADNSATPFAHLRTEENEDCGTSHPYGRRLRALLDHPPLGFRFMKSSEDDNEEPPGMEEPFVWIDTREELQALAESLSEETEFAVDTEQHSLHSFHGFTALVQISTRKADYLVDAIALHDSMHILGPLFANPAICKLFHGADSDILWLQRDFHIYVVNMFDTAKACQVLAKPQRSLAALLQMYCNVATNKAFQRADWRMRPLPEDMLEYARMDVHYLLYIAHQLCVELVGGASGESPQEFDEKSEAHSRKSLEQALHRSNLNCLQLYEKDGVSANPRITASNLLSRFGSSHVQSQKGDQVPNLVTVLCEWRDNVARVEDESLRAVLSDEAVIALSFCNVSPSIDLIYSTISAADSAATSAGATAPLLSPSPVLRKHGNDLCEVIQRSKMGASEEQSLGSLKASTKSYLERVLETVFSLFKFSDVVVKDGGGQREDPSWSTAESSTSTRSRSWSSEKSRIQFVKKFSCKAPVYHNCQIYADDGRLLCFCDRKKLEWYVRRGLAEYVQEDPPAVRLLFEPKGRPEDEGNEFYIQSKYNRCVGCGESSHYLRYRIIPSCYRQHFPEHLKSHRSHDIVLLCVDCHEVVHKAAERHKRAVAAEYGVPLFAKVVDADALLVGGDMAEVAGLGADVERGVPPSQLKNAALALLRHGQAMPTKRREELENVVQTYYGRDSVSEEDLRSVLLLSMKPQTRRRFMRKASCKQHGSADRTAESLGSQVSSPRQRREKESFSLPVDQASTTTSLSGEMERTAFESRCGSLDGRNDAVRGEINQDTLGAEGLLSSQRQSNQGGVHRKESLLGHGQHGRLVVEKLMNQEGEEGIRKFIQQWRKVFVDTLHPSFLPLGWEISHSGRREFGDFSIYKVSEDRKSTTTRNNSM